MRILIAEDERDLNSIITKKLSADGYSVDSCFDGNEAIEYLDAAEYDAVILDIMMPHTDGFGVLSHIRKQGKTRLYFSLLQGIPLLIRLRDLTAVQMTIL